VRRFVHAYACCGHLRQVDSCDYVAYRHEQQGILGLDQAPETRLGVAYLDDLLDVEHCRFELRHVVDRRDDARRRADPDARRVRRGADPTGKERPHRDSGAQQRRENDTKDCPLHPRSIPRQGGDEGPLAKSRLGGAGAESTTPLPARGLHGAPQNAAIVPPMGRALPRSACCALTGSAALWVPAAVLASSPPGRPAELHYVRDATAQSCVEQEELQSKVSSRLGYVPFQDHAPLIVTVRLSRSDKGFRAVLTSEDTAAHTSGSREISSGSRDCGELLESVALAISVVIDPLTLSRPEAPANPHIIVLPPPRVESPPPAPQPPAPPEKVLDEAPIPVSAAPVEHVPVTVEASLALVASAGAEPSPALGYALAVGLRRRSLSLAVEGRADMPAGSDAVDGRSVRSNVMVGSVVPCIRPGPLLGCAVLSAGALNGTGEGVALSSPRTTFYAAAGARGGAEWAPWDSLAFGGYVEVLATLTRTDLRLNGTIVWTTPPFSGGLGLQAIGRF
jgi:hypothetical protein